MHTRSAPGSDGEGERVIAGRLPWGLTALAPPALLVGLLGHHAGGELALLLLHRRRLARAPSTALGPASRFA